MEHRTDRPVNDAGNAPHYMQDAEASIAYYMADGLRERLLGAAICKCGNCKTELHTFNAWCFDFTAADSEAEQLANNGNGEWFTDYSDNPQDYRIKRAK